MKLPVKELVWWFADSLAWVMSGLRKPESGSGIRTVRPSHLYKSSGGVYPLKSKAGHPVLSNGQMVLPEIVRPYDFFRE